MCRFWHKLLCLSIVTALMAEIPARAGSWGVEIYVIDLGWHTGIVIPADYWKESGLPFLSPYGQSLEVGWGQRHYYMAKNPSVFSAMRAILPSASVLHVVLFASDPRVFFQGGEVATLELPPQALRRLLVFINHSFARDHTGAVKQLGPGLYGESEFFAATGRFSAFNTCNSWVAQALTEAGCCLKNRSVIAASALMKELKGLRRCECSPE